MSDFEFNAELAQRMEEHRERLHRMVRLRVDNRLRSRIDPSDVLQETFLEAARRYGDFQRENKMPFFLWLRFLTGQKLLQLHRVHLGVQARDAAREVSLYRGALPAATSAALAAQLVGKITSPSVAAKRAEAQLQIQEALNSMSDGDREVLTLRHFEHLSNAEAAQELGIEESAASKRYIRALRRLRDVISQIPRGESLLD